MHNEEPYALSYTPNTIRLTIQKGMGLTGHVARIGGRRVASRVLVGKTDGRRTLGRPGHR